MQRSEIKLLPMSTDNRDSWSLDGKVPLSPSHPGETVDINSTFAGPLAFVGIRIGLDKRLRAIGPRGTHGNEVSGRWRVDEVKIDEVPSESVIRALEAQALIEKRTDLGHETARIEGDFGVGSQVRIRATNVGDAPAYFYAIWELEEVRAADRDLAVETSSSRPPQSDFLSTAVRP